MVATALRWCRRGIRICRDSRWPVNRSPRAGVRVLATGLHGRRAVHPDRLTIVHCRRLAAVCLAAVALLCAAPLHAQQLDVIRGLITGPDSIPIAGAHVTATSLSGNVNTMREPIPRGATQSRFRAATVTTSSRSPRWVSRRAVSR